MCVCVYVYMCVCVYVCVFVADTHCRERETELFTLVWEHDSSLPSSRTAGFCSEISESVATRRHRESGHPGRAITQLSSAQIKRIGPGGRQRTTHWPNAVRTAKHNGYVLEMPISHQGKPHQMTRISKLQITKF